MYPNLIALKAIHHLTESEMGKIIGVSRNTFRNRMLTGKFTADECKVLCQYFNSSFDVLFANEALQNQTEDTAASEG